MKKLYLHFTSLSLILLCSAGAIQGMEVTVPQTQAIDQLTVIPSLKQLCLDYIGNNAQHEKINLVDNLVNLPTDLASGAVSSADHGYLYQHQNTLMEMVQSNALDRSISCALAEKTRNGTLAYELAKSGPITDGVALLIIDKFLNLDITNCLTNFDSTFNKMFPQEILKYDNEARLYRLLMNKVTASFYQPTWENNNEAIFSVQDFEQNLSVEKIAQYVARKGFINKNFDNACANGYVSLSPCKNFIFFTEKHPATKVYTLSEVHNLKTGSKIKVFNIPVLQHNITIDKIAFSQDCSHVGILDKNGNIYNFEFLSMLCDNISLQKLACVAYCFSGLNNKFPVTDGTKIGLGYILFEAAEISDEEFMLVDFTQENILADVELLPIHIYKYIEDCVVNFEHTWTMTRVLDIASEQLQMTKKEIATKWFIDQDQEFTNNLYAIIIDYFDEEMLGDINAAIRCLSQYMGIFLNDRNAV